MFAGKDLGELPNLSKEIYVDKEDNGGQIEVSKNDVVIISLQADPSTGYRWQVEETDRRILRQVGKIEFKQESKLLGAPGKQTLNFKVVGAGRSSLELIYRRPWEKKAVPAKIFYIQVIVH